MKQKARVAFPMINSTLCLLLLGGRLAAQQDGPPVDVQQLLQALKGLKEQQVVQAKAIRQKAIQDISGAAASGSVAASAWEEAVRQVQFQGASKEGTQFREWKEREGDALGEKEVQSAARLYFNWMVITLQRSGGAQVKDLMPAVLQHIGGVLQDRVAAEALEERIKHEREMAQTGKRPGGKDKRKDDEVAKRMHDHILNGSLPSGAPAQALRIRELLTVPGWEMNPGNVDGIYQNVVLPEFRASKDPRLMDYWEMRLKRESEAAGKAKLAYEVERFNQVRKPEVLWQRAQDMIVLGMKNRGLTEMLNLIKAHPAHPNCAGWIASLEKTLTPGESGAASAGAVESIRGGDPVQKE
jgi:hypothetical protein